jgi:hypothetical protein
MRPISYLIGVFLPRTQILESESETGSAARFGRKLRLYWQRLIDGCIDRLFVPKQSFLVLQPVPVRRARHTENP